MRLFATATVLPIVDPRTQHLDGEPSDKHGDAEGLVSHDGYSKTGERQRSSTDQHAPRQWGSNR